MREAVTSAPQEQLQGPVIQGVRHVLFSVSEATGLTGWQAAGLYAVEADICAGTWQ